jgi:hypothetical protein
VGVVSVVAGAAVQVGGTAAWGTASTVDVGAAMTGAVAADVGRGAAVGDTWPQADRSRSMTENGNRRSIAGAAPSDLKGILSFLHLRPVSAKAFHPQYGYWRQGMTSR